MNSQTTFYYYTKMYDDFKKAAFKASSEAQKYLPPENEIRIVVLSNLSLYYSIFGNYDQAIKYSNKALELKLNNKLSVYEITVSYINLATFYKYIGENQKSIDFYKKGLNLIKTDTSKHLEITSIIHAGLGLVFSSINQLDSAIHYQQKEELALLSTPSTSLFKNNKIDAFINLAELFIKDDASQKAMEYINKAFALSPDINHKIHLKETLGKFSLSKNKYKEATVFFLKAESLAEKFQKRNTPPIKARRLIQLAKVYTLSADYDNALVTYQKALNTLAPTFNNNDLFENPPLENMLAKLDVLAILNKKAEVLFKLFANNKDQKYLSAANSTYLTATDLIRQLRQDILSTESKNILAKNSISTYEGAIQSTFELYQITKDKKYKAAAFALTENNKALLLLESITEQTAKGFAGIPDSLLDKEKDLNLQLAFLEKSIINDKVSGVSTKKIEDQKFDIQQSLEHLRSNFEKDYPRYFELKYKNEPTGLKTIQQELAKDNSALLEYFVGEKHIYIFTVTKDDLKIQTIDDPTLVYHAIQQLRPILNTPPRSTDPKKDFLEFTNSSFDLYKLLLQTTLEELPKDIKRLTIIPDDQLNYIPFDILIREKADHNKPGYSIAHLQYLMEDYVINYHYSATLLYKSQQRKKQSYEKDFIGFAPSFKDSENFIANRSCTSDELYSLKCSRDEVMNISELLNGDSRFDQEANTANFKNKASAYRIIHLATHACIDENNSNLNKIFLTDDYLSSFDLYNLELNTELAVLSACNTGSGELVKGEGVMNLARGFINAGCSSTLMSMWSVDDCATSDIMYHFYEGLKRGLKKDKALQVAKLSYLSKASKTKMHPYYWAPFVSFGNAEAMKFKENVNYFVYFIPLILLGLVFLFFRWRK